MHRVYPILTLLALAISAILYTQLTVARDLLAQQHTLLTQQRAVIAQQQEHITQTRLLAAVRPHAVAMR